MPAHATVSCPIIDRKGHIISALDLFCQDDDDARDKTTPSRWLRRRVMAAGSLRRPTRQDAALRPQECRQPLSCFAHGAGNYSAIAIALSSIANYGIASSREKMEIHCAPPSIKKQRQESTRTGAFENASASRRRPEAFFMQARFHHWNARAHQTLRAASVLVLEQIDEPDPCP